MKKIAELRQQIVLMENQALQEAKAIQAARRYAENIVDTVHEPLLVLNADLKVISVNKSFHDTFKLTQKEIIGLFIYDIGNHQWDIPALRTLLEEILPKDTQFNNYEVSHKFQTIGQKIMLLNARQIYREDIGSDLILLAIEDITERKLSEKKSHEARIYAESIIDTVREPFLVLDKDLKVLSASRSFYSTFKVRPEETLRNLIYDIGDRQWDIPALRTLLEKILPEDTQFNNFEVSHKFQTIGQKIMLLNARQIYREDSGSNLILLAIEDITERRQTEEDLNKYRQHLEELVDYRTAKLKTANDQLQQDIVKLKRLENELTESEERYRRLFEVSRDGLFLLDKSTFHIITLNQAGLDMLGIPREEILGKSLVDIGLFKDSALLQDIFQKLYKDGHIRVGDILIETKFKGIIDAEIILVDRTRVIQCNVRDMTERKNTEKLRLEKECLEHANKTRSEFLASMSHELRTPLNAVIGFSELMNMGLAGDLSEKQKKYVSNISISGNFLLTLINDILDMSKIEAGKIELNIERTHIPTVIEEAIILIKEKAKKNKISVTIELDTCIEFLDVDKQRFKQILFNLLSNAIKFSKEKGGKITISLNKVENMAEISVLDTGIGIKPENLSKLFQKFEQLEKGISTKYGGTGLGLAISKELVELHGGRIWADSKYGKGTTFTFALPINQGKR